MVPSAGSEGGGAEENWAVVAGVSAPWWVSLAAARVHMPAWSPWLPSPPCCEAMLKAGFTAQPVSGGTGGVANDAQDGRRVDMHGMPAAKEEQ